MILTILQLTALLATFLRLATYCPRGGRYRPFVSLLASVWAGGALAIAASMVLAWPEAVSDTTVLTAGLSGASVAAAFWCNGNVAELLRLGKALFRPAH